MFPSILYVYIYKSERLTLRSGTRSVVFLISYMIGFDGFHSFDSHCVLLMLYS